MDEIIYTEEDNLVFVKERNLKIEIGFFDLKKQAGASFKLTTLAELEDFKKMINNTEKKIHNLINDNIFDSKEEETEYERIMKDNVEEFETGIPRDANVEADMSIHSLNEDDKNVTS